MSRLNRDPRSRKSLVNRPINRDQVRQRYREVIRDDKRNGDLRSLRIPVVDAGLGLGKMPNLRAIKCQQNRATYI